MAEATRRLARPDLSINVGRPERMASAALGGALIVLGFRRRSPGGAAMALLGGGLLYRGVSGHCRLYQALGRSTAGYRDRAPSGAPDGTLEIERSITIGKTAEELYHFWRQPNNLSRIMGHFAEITSENGGRMRWKVRGPFGRVMEWDAQTVEERPGEFLLWESLEGADLPNVGMVRFRPAPAGQGTEVSLHFNFIPPGGALGAAALGLLDLAPKMVAGKALRRFKSLVETGEIPTLERNPSARGRGDTF
jgi:uncharacterized membrane protein